MDTTMTVGVKTLKNQLSAYLREVKAGKSVLITEHGVVIAELRQLSDRSLPTDENPIRVKWIKEGKLKPASQKKSKCRPSLVNKRKGFSLDLLDMERAE